MSKTSNGIKKRSLGETRIDVTPIGMGTWQFAGGYRGPSGWYWPHISQETCTAIVKSALDAGINWFDTAEIYGSGRSEKMLGSALKASGCKPGDIAIVDKWWPSFRWASSIPGTIRNRLSAIKYYPIDLYLVHQPNSFSSLESQMNYMADLVDAKKVGSVGISNFCASKMRACHRILKSRGIKLAVNEVNYNLLNRQIEKNGILDAAKELGVTIIAWSPLDQGLLTGCFHKDPSHLKRMTVLRRYMYGFTTAKLRKTYHVIQALEKMAAKYKSTVAQIALNWLINVHGETVVAITGASKPSQIEDNAGAMLFKMDSKDIDKLSRLTGAG